MNRYRYFVMVIVIIICVQFVSCTPESNRPNVLFAIMDDATYSHFGVYGCEWVDTPNFDRIADNGILFTNAYTPNAKCAPSRSSILTGRNSWQLEEAANHWPYFPEKFKTFTEVLSENGYWVGYTGKGWAPGNPGKLNRMPRQLIGQAYNDKKLNSPTTGISPIDYASNFIDFLDLNESDKPFFFWFGAKEPHRSYEFGSGINKGKKELSDIEEVYSFWPENDSIVNDLLDYAYEIEYFDYQLGLMIKELEKRELIDNTMIVVTSDNGMPFPRIKGQSYELSNHMPLAIQWPQEVTIKKRKIVDFISFIDFAPTFLEIANIDFDESGMEPVQGESFTHHLFSNKSGLVDETRDHVLIGKERHDVGRPNDQGYPIRGIVKDKFLLLQNFELMRWPSGNPETGYLNCDGSPTKTICLDSREYEESFKYWQWSFGKRPEYELYNIQEDPFCIDNLAYDQRHKSILADLKNQLIMELKDQEDPRMNNQGHVFDEYVYADPATVNFYERYMNNEKLNTSWVNPSDFRPLN